MARLDTILYKPKNTRGALIRLLRYLGPFRWVILLVAVMCVISNILSLWGPHLAGMAINEAAAGEGKVDFDAVMRLASGMLVCYLSSSVISVGISIAMMNVSKRLAKRMRQNVFNKLMKLPVGYFDCHQAGDIMSRVNYDIDVISSCLSTDVVSVLAGVVKVIGAAVMMIVISPPLSAIVMISIPASIIYAAQIRKKTQPRYVRRSKSYGRMNGFTEEMLSGQKTIQAYAYGKAVNARFDEVNRGAADAFHDSETLGVTVPPTVGFINNIVVALTVLFGSILFMNGLIELGSVSSFLLYSRMYSGPVNEIANITSDLFSALAASERVFELLDSDEESVDTDNAIVLGNIDGTVEAEHVSFGYDAGRTVLHDLSLRADAGKLIAIVGPTGAGKTTIINLLMRFYDPLSGKITIDGNDIASCTRRSVRGSYAMVLQDTWVFCGTIFDNIAYGKDGATLDEVVAAAKAAHIHPFIMRLPEGYNTVIGEDGGNISKGQKQLITIARAMLFDSEMLILDEATSNVDTSTEKAIQAAMRSLMSDRTCFVIAHRLSTIQNADRILVLEKGDVTEQGTHKELMARKGSYYRLYRSQFE